MRKSIFISIISLGLTLISLFFKADGTLFGAMATNIIYRGFPFHFLETYRSASYVFLFWWFLFDTICYAVVISAVWYLVALIFKNKNLAPFITAAALGIFFFWINITQNDSCVSGFPIEFYLKCIGDGTISKGYILSGYTIDPLFWFALSAVAVALIYSVFSSKQFRLFLLNKNVFWTVFSAWIILALISILCLFGDSGEDDGMTLNAVLAFAGIFILFRLRKFYKKSKETGKRFFLSKIGYIALGISLGLVTVSTTFNLFYTGGWFDFTDLGFALLSYPLILFTHFQPDNTDPLKRLILYGIAALNLILIILVLDLAGFLAVKSFHLVFKPKNS